MSKPCRRAVSFCLPHVLAAALAVLIGLGLWQLQRLQWKEGLIAQIEARVKAEPVSLKEAVAQASAGEDVSYLRVRVEGSFDNAKERYLFAVSDGTPGWHVITPLETPDREMVLVDRGFVPDALRDPAARPQGEISDAVTVTALARPPETQGLFVPDNEIEQNRWFWRDLKAMTKSMFGEGAKELRPSSSRPRRAMSPAVGRGAGRPGSISPTTICNTR